MVMIYDHDGLSKYSHRKNRQFQPVTPYSIKSAANRYVIARRGESSHSKLAAGLIRFFRLVVIEEKWGRII